MSRVIVQYKVWPEQAGHNENLIRAVYAELAAATPDGFRYATVKLDDGVTFVHIAEQSGPGDNPLTKLAAFAEFQRGIAERCEEPPVVRQATLIGSFRLFSGD
jgi:hypothetical protein